MVGSCGMQIMHYNQEDNVDLHRVDSDEIDLSGWLIRKRLPSMVGSCGMQIMQESQTDISNLLFADSDELTHSTLFPRISPLSSHLLYGRHCSSTCPRKAD